MEVVIGNRRMVRVVVDGSIYIVPSEVVEVYSNLPKFVRNSFDKMLLLAIKNKNERIIDLLIDFISPKSVVVSKGLIGAC